MSRPSRKSKYDLLNADVRIDNVLVPGLDVFKFRAEPVDFPGMPALAPIFKSRDLSAERERPMINLVVPSPPTTPAPEYESYKLPPKPDREDEHHSQRDSDGDHYMEDAPDTETNFIDVADDTGSSATAVSASARKKRLNWATIAAALTREPGGDASDIEGGN